MAKIKKQTKALKHHISHETKSLLALALVEDVGCSLSTRGSARCFHPRDDREEDESPLPTGPLATNAVALTDDSVNICALQADGTLRCSWEG